MKLKQLLNKREKISRIQRSMNILNFAMPELELVTELYVYFPFFPSQKFEIHDLENKTLFVFYPWPGF